MDEEIYGGFRRLSATFEELEAKANASEETEDEIKSRETSIARFDSLKHGSQKILIIIFFTTRPSFSLGGNTSNHIKTRFPSNEGKK